MFQCIKEKNGREYRIQRQKRKVSEKFRNAFKKYEA